MTIIWRDRRRLAEGALALTLAISTAWFAAGSGRAEEKPPTADSSRPAVLVTVTPARDMEFHEDITSDGTIEARFYSVVSPRTTGILETVEVREGDATKRGETVLFRLDNERLEQAVEQARQALVIARSTLDEKKATLVKAQADLSQTRKDFARTRSLYEQKVVPLAEFEADETRVIQNAAEVRVAETNVELAAQNVTMAEISLRMAEKDLRDSVEYAPLDGVVSARHAEPGEMGSPGKAVVRIDDTRRLKAVAYLPGQFYPRITVGKSVAEVRVHGEKVGDFPVTYKSPAIDSALRTYEIWAELDGDGEYAVPGAQCVIRVELRRSRGVGVPRDALQLRDGKYWIFVPDGGRARIVEVVPGLETGGWTELVGSPLKPGDGVVTQGQFLLVDGQAIRERTTGK